MRPVEHHSQGECARLQPGDAPALAGIRLPSVAHGRHMLVDPSTAEPEFVRGQIREDVLAGASELMRTR